MPQTWDAKGNLIQPASQAALPPTMPGSAAANPNAPAVMPPTAKPKQVWDEKGKPIQAKPLAQTTEKSMPFTSGTYSAMGLDPEKIIPETQKGIVGVAKGTGEALKETGLNIAKWLNASALDPYHLADPAKFGLSNLKDSFNEVHEGLKSGNHDKIMHGLGLATGTIAPILVDQAGKAPGIAKGVEFAAKDLTAKRAIISAASHGMLDALKDDHSAAIDTAVKAERQRIGGAVASLNTKDIAKDPNGYVPQKLALATLDQAISDKKAQVLMNERQLPKVRQVRGLLQGHAQNLTFNDLKQVRSVVGDAVGKASGVEKAVLGDYYSSLTKNLKGRAAFLGGLPEWEDYNTSSEKLASHEEGLIPELKDSKTGLEYAKKISSEQNQGRLDTLTKDLHMPSDTFSSAVKSHKAIINFAKMTEGDSLQARMANRLIALKSHPISAAMGGTAGVLAGRAIGTAVGSPMAGSFIGLTLGAAFAHDLMSKYDAAKAIREIGGPSGVMGVRVPPQSTSATSPQSPGGPAGGGRGPSPQPAPRSPGSPPASLSPALERLLLKVEGVKTKAKPSEVGGREAKGAEAAKAVASNVPFQKAQFDAAIDKAKETIRDSKATPEEKEIAKSQLQTYREQAAKLEEPKVTKVPSEARGRTESVRKGMTKDTPEARRAKAAERIAAKRSEASRTQIKGSLEDQARQVAGRMDFQGKSNIELEEGLQELFGDNGKRFMKEFKNLAKQKKWSDDVYRGYLEETLKKRAEELAKRPNIPGLESEAKN